MVLGPVEITLLCFIAAIFWFDGRSLRMWPYGIRSAALFMWAVTIPSAFFSSIASPTLPIWVAAIIASWTFAGASFGFDDTRSRKGTICGALAGFGLAVVFLAAMFA